MTTAMGPPSQRNPPPTDPASAATTTAEPKPLAEPPPTATPASSSKAKFVMGPPPPLLKSPTEPDTDAGASISEEEKPQANNSSQDSHTTTETESPEEGEQKVLVVQKQQQQHHHPPVPYSIPEWSGPPCHKFYLEVLKDGSIIDRWDVCEKGAYMFGRVDLCDFVLEHPTISRFHAVVQFKRNGDAYLYDLSSTHGTFLNKKQVEKNVYIQLRVGDVICFGQSSRLYILQGPPDLMPPETDMKILRDAKMRQQMLDREASLRRARKEASLADGISWGMGEDAIEEAEDDVDEITWQTYKGQLTEKQEKTREKIIKRTEKIAHMKKEIDAIRVKDISQGGLTQGQQTQIARNEQRIAQILEELENLEETLNDSIRESIGARAGKSHGKKGTAEDNEELLSDDDDDDFYDRTKKPSVQKAGENQSIETADSLLDKRDAIMKLMEAKKELLLIEKDQMASETSGETDVGDALDAYMTGLSSQLVLDKTTRLEKEISAFQSELDRILFLLKFADPFGEVAKRRDSREKASGPDTAEVLPATKKKPSNELKNEQGKPINVSMQNEKLTDSRIATIESNDKLEAEKTAIDAPEGEAVVYTVAKPQWLGAVDERDVQEIQHTEASNVDESDHFVDYKDRQKIQRNVDRVQNKMDSGIESAAPGLIIRKRKETDRPDTGDSETREQSTSSMGAEFVAEDAVALLLKHTRGYPAEESEEQSEIQDKLGRSEISKDNKKPKRVLGPEKPTFLKSNSDFESWVPPEGQSGDGRTSLNDRLGY